MIYFKNKILINLRELFNEVRLIAQTKKFNVKDSKSRSSKTDSHLKQKEEWDGGERDSEGEGYKNYIK